MKSLLNLFKPYRVVVIWDGEVFRHRAWTFAEALEWMACYSEGAVNVFNRRGRWLASRRKA